MQATSRVTQRAGPATGTWLSRNVLVLGAVSLLNDAASEMVIPLLPVFLTVYLGAGAFALGVIEGAADAVASILKLVSGRLADRAGRYRPFVIAGYALSATARPLVALAGSAAHVLAVRVADRTGKGVRTSPRDALIAASVLPSQRGAAFGLHRALDHAGAVLGPAAALAVLGLWTTDLRALFLLSAVPGTLAVLLVVFGTSESAGGLPRYDPGAGTACTEPAGEAREGKLLRFLAPLALFTLGNASDVFLLLRAGEARAPLESLPVLWMALHVVKAGSSVAGGHIADWWGARRTVVAGWLLYAGVYAGFAFAPDTRALLALFVVYGAYHGLTEGPERALVAGLSPSRRRGTAFGWYHLTLGLLGFASSVLFGGLWNRFGSRAAFLTSAGLALAAALWLAAAGRKENPRSGGFR